MTDSTQPRNAVGSSVQRHELRRVAGNFYTGVTVVTYKGAMGFRGVTVNSFTSVSIDPPLVLVSLARTARASEGIRASAFAINVLGVDQVDLAMHFAGRQQEHLRIDWQTTTDGEGAPTLGGSLAQLQCHPWQTYDGGDHLIHVAEVMSLAHRPGTPLLFGKGMFHAVGRRIPEDLRDQSGAEGLGRLLPRSHGELCCTTDSEREEQA